MDFVSASATEVAIDINGQTQSFPKLKRSEVAKLHALWIVQERSAELKRLEEAGVTAAEKLTALREFDQESKRLGWLFMRVGEPDRAGEVLKASLPALDVGNLPLPPEQFCRLACEVLGLPLPKPDEKNEKDGARPLAGNAASGIGS